jgi:hypothetical protein
VTPIEASKKENENIVYNNLYDVVKTTKICAINNVQTRKNKFKVGNKVRISKYKGTFDKGYIPNWTTELFTVSKVLNTNPVAYKIKSGNEDEIEGIYYEPELVQFDKQDQEYEVEKILKTRTRNEKKELKIMSRGYSLSMASWIPVENLKN